MKRRERLAVAREFSRLVELYDPRPRLTFIYSDGTGDILPADEDSDKWKAEAKVHCWLDAKPCVTFLSKRGPATSCRSISGEPAHACSQVAYDAGHGARPPKR